MGFVILGAIRQVETIAVGRGIREYSRLIRTHGPGRWRKRKGVATVWLAHGRLASAEVHWYEASGIGRRELKLKRLLDPRP